METNPYMRRREYKKKWTEEKIAHVWIETRCMLCVFFYFSSHLDGISCMNLWIIILNNKICWSNTLESMAESAHLLLWYWSETKWIFKWKIWWNIKIDRSMASHGFSVDHSNTIANAIKRWTTNKNNQKSLHAMHETNTHTHTHCTKHLYTCNFRNNSFINEIVCLLLIGLHWLIESFYSLLA